jgi:hypothetical protein
MKSEKKNGSSNGLSKRENGSSPSESSSLYVVAVLGCLVIATLSFAAGIFTPATLSLKSAYDSQQR